MMLLVINYHKSLPSTTSFAKEQIICLYYNFVINNLFTNVLFFFFILHRISTHTKKIFPDELNEQTDYIYFNDEQMETSVNYVSRSVSMTDT